MRSLVIQAGGKSSRMGRDKGLVELHGRPLVEHVIERLANLADEILVVTNHPEDYQYLGLPILSDPLDKREFGSAQGMITALRGTSYEKVCIAAVDMPFVSAELYLKLLSLLAHPIEAVVPVYDGFPHPFHGVYLKSKILPLFEENVAQNILSVNKILRAGQTFLLSNWPDGRPFININTPEDLKAARHISPDET